MNWNHRVVKTEYKKADGTVLETLYAIHEACYEEDAGMDVSESHAAPFCETLDGLREELARMTRALDNPVIEQTVIV